MQQRLELDAEVREGNGKASVKQLREQGIVPGVLYGRDRETVSVKAEATEVEDVLGGNAIIDLTLDDGSTQPVMVKEVQRDVITRDLLHIDLYQIALDEDIIVDVPVEVVGQAEGEREGGLLNQILREVEIECLPTDIPEKIEVDVSELGIGDSVDVSDLDVGEDIDVRVDASETVATVVLPDELDEEEEEEEEELEEPEVIGEEPEEGEEELEEGEEGEEEFQG
ncbi:50S ribosomal protein L25 [Halanaerobacter jeridensis]|uniref:Large ribosomal subunit protein bL25 n=1 Tax=Halanaerobacter jeridensis TaxID=706427 RepID=A0A938XTF2_9FIRM|nr:50S ribosomal protein L25 [Halanaerobacter jeridensis]MBM7557208.1 large subunit ribosomal protein L25 [Halanaerobacter jeridensis]